jgi:hypothetical protein
MLPSGLCRVPHSAKPLPSAKGSLPSVKTLGKVLVSSSDALSNALQQMLCMNTKYFYCFGKIIVVCKTDVLEF